jgi:hypothetical protein
MDDQKNIFEIVLKAISPILAIAVFFWGIYTYHDTSKNQLEAQIAEAKRSAETRRIEATLPYLNKQLDLYTEATQITAIIATSIDQEEISIATKRFNELYWGELAMVERSEVAQAMVDFHRALEDNKGKVELKNLALKLAHACRDELAESWGTDAWKR